MIKEGRYHEGWLIVDDNIWEYPFGELDEDDDVLFHNHDMIKGDTLEGGTF